MEYLKALSWTWRIVLAVVAAVLLFLAYNFVDDLFSKEDEVRAELSENQTTAAIESGHDTVTTVTSQHTKEIERTETVRVIQEEVNNAEDVHSAHVAGANGLCVNFGVCAEE